MHVNMSSVSCVCLLVVHHRMLSLFSSFIGSFWTFCYFAQNWNVRSTVPNMWQCFMVTHNAVVLWHSCCVCFVFTLENWFLLLKLTSVSFHVYLMLFHPFGYGGHIILILHREILYLFLTISTSTYAVLVWDNLSLATHDTYSYARMRWLNAHKGHWHRKSVLIQFY